MAKRISVLIVLYNKELIESETIKSLYNLNLPSLSIVIVNNGPTLLTENDFFQKIRKKFPSVTLKNFTSNKPLSWVYNDFINEFVSDRYVILDDDTSLTGEYFNDLVFSNEEYMLGLPRMVSSYDHKQYTPFFNGEIRSSTHGTLSGNCNFSISSALVLSGEIIDVIKKRFGTVFDEHLALYNVDNTLFLRIETIVNEGNVKVNYLSNVCLLHDFSNIHANEEPQWRIEEKLIAQTISLRNYFQKTFRQVVKQVFFKVVELKFRDCYVILRSYIEGRHPRCRQPRSI